MPYKTVMDGYKKIILVGCLLLLTGYFLPWLSTLTATHNGLDALLVGLDAVRTMRALGQYEYHALAAYAALALPMTGALLSLLYCMIKPSGGNGGFATALFLLPLVSLGLTCAYLALGSYGSAPGDTLAVPLARQALGSMMDLSKTGGLWLVLLGSVLMGLGRMAK